MVKVHWAFSIESESKPHMAISKRLTFPFIAIIFLIPVKVAHLLTAYNANKVLLQKIINRQLLVFLGLSKCLSNGIFFGQS